MLKIIVLLLHNSVTGDCVEVPKIIGEHTQQHMFYLKMPICVNRSENHSKQTIVRRPPSTELFFQYRLVG